MKHEQIARVRSNAVPIAVAVAAIIVAALLWWPRLYPLDDPYITLSNARVLLSGQSDHSYDTSYLTGATSPIHLLLVMLGSLVMPAVWAPLVLGLAGAALYLLALLRVTDALKLTVGRKIAVIAIGFLNGNNLFQYLNGLETSLCMAAVAWMLIWCDDRRKLPLLAGLAPFLRPELGLLSALLLVRLALKSNWTQCVRMGMIAALAAAPWIVWLFLETGHVLPNTIGAKLAFFHPVPISVPLRTVLVLYLLVMSFNLPMFAGLPGLFTLPGGRYASSFIVIGIIASAAIMPTIIDWNFGRYAAIYVPLLALGIVAMAADRSRIVTILLSVLFTCAMVTAAFSVRAYGQEIAYARQVQDHARFVAKLPASSVILIHDAGQVAWESPKGELVDIVGLKTPEVVSIHEKLTSGECKRTKSLDAIGQKYSATHLVVINRWSWPCISRNMREAGWGLRPIYKDLYTVFELTPPPHAKSEPRSSAKEEGLTGR